MSEKRRVLLLIAILCVSTLLVACIAIGLLYRTAIRQQRERLVETVQSEARLIEAIAVHVARVQPGRSPEYILRTTVGQIMEAHRNYEKEGRSTEFDIARRTGNLIVFLLRHRHDDLRTTPIVKWGVGLAEPMQMALSGKSGTLIGRDYRGVPVLAAYEPVAGLGLGIVAKIDVSELRAPLVKAGAASIAVALLTVLGGVALFQRITGPMLRRIREHSHLLEKVNASLNREIADRRRAQESLAEKAAALNSLNEDLENRVRERTAEIAAANRQLAIEIQERRQAQAELARSEVMLQSVFDGIYDPLLLVDRHMSVLMLNVAAIRYYGVDPGAETPLGKTCSDAFGRSGACEGCRIPGAVREGRHLSYERRGMMDPVRTERVVVYPLDEGGDDTGSAVVHVVDITEAKQVEKQMIQSEKLASLGMLVPSIAHEINNPNNFVTFNIPILRDYLSEILPIVDAHAETNPGLELCNMAYPEFRRDLRKLVENIGHGADRISAFVRNLREFSQFKGQLCKSWIDPAQTAARALSICNSKLKCSARTVIVEVPDDLPKIYSDPHALEQILINLLVNAAQAADKPDAWVKLAIAVTDSWAERTVMEVSDNGRGMDAETLGQIFDPFFTTKSCVEGTGLGLYVCRSLVGGLGGRLEAESEAGKGSRFRVTLPDRDRRETPRPPARRG